MKFKRISYKEWKEVFHIEGEPELNLIGDFIWFAYTAIYFPFKPFLVLFSLIARKIED